MSKMKWEQSGYSEKLQTDAGVAYATPMRDGSLWSAWIGTSIGRGPDVGGFEGTLAEAKAAAEAALTPPDPLEAEAKSMGLEWDGNMLFGDCGTIYVNGSDNDELIRRATLAAARVLLNKPAPKPEATAERPALPTLPDGWRFVIEDGREAWRCPKATECFYADAFSLIVCAVVAFDKDPQYIVEPIPAPAPAKDDATSNVETPQQFAERMVSLHDGVWQVGEWRGGAFEFRGAINNWSSGSCPSEARRGIAHATTERDANRDKVLIARLREHVAKEVGYVDEYIRAAFDTFTP